MLRHPVTRFVSAYFNMVLKKDSGNPVIPRSIRDGRGLAYYIEEVREQGNWMGGLRPLCYFETMNDRSGVKHPVCPQLSTETVIARTFERFELIGINERFDESLFLMSLLLGLQKLPKWEIRQNTKRPRLIDLRIDLILQIEDLVQDDYELYASARAYFDNRYEHALNYFKDHIGSLRSPGDSNDNGHARILRRLAAAGAAPGRLFDAKHGLVSRNSAEWNE